MTSWAGQAVLLLLRHGESTGNEAMALGRGAGLVTHPSTWPLTPTGQVQAQWASSWLRRALGRALVPPVTRVFTSPMNRAVETVSIALAALAPAVPEPFLAPELSERTFGSYFEGVAPRDQLSRVRQAAAEAAKDPWGWTPRGGESLADVRVRVAAWLRGWMSSRPTGTSLVCTHGDVLLVLRSIIELDPSASLLATGVTRVANAGWLGYRPAASTAGCVERIYASQAECEAEARWCAIPGRWPTPAAAD